MADNEYEHDGDVSRFFLQAPPPPPPESPLLAPPNDEPSAASHVEAPHDVPAVEMGVAPAAPRETTTMPLNLADPAFGFPAPATDDDNNHPALAVDVLIPPQADGFPDDDPAFEALFDDIVLPNLETESLNDDYLFMDDQDDDEIVRALIRSIQDAGNTDTGRVVAEDTAVPRVEDDYRLDFVPFVRGELDCSNCRSVRKMLHESANHKLHFDVHVADHQTFQHAIFDRTYIDANGQTILNETVYLDLRQRMHEWVQNFIANSVEMLKNDTSGQLKDSCSTSSAAICTNISTPANNHDPHRELEMDMLTKIFSSLTASTEEEAPQFAPDAPQPATRAEQNINADDILIDAATRAATGLIPAILESYQVAVKEGASSSISTNNNRLLAKQTKRISDVTVEDILKCIHMSKKDAAKELNISSTSLKRLCRKYNTHRWPARKFIAIDNKIKKLQDVAKRHVGMKGLLAIKEEMDKLIHEKAQLRASVMKGIKEYEKHVGGAGPSGSK